MICFRQSVCVLAKSLQPCPTLWPNSVGLFCSRDSPDKNTGVGCHALLQGIFPAQGLNPCLLVHPLAGGFLTTEPPRKLSLCTRIIQKSLTEFVGFTKDEWVESGCAGGALIIALSIISVVPYLSGVPSQFCRIFKKKVILVYTVYKRCMVNRRNFIPQLFSCLGPVFSQSSMHRYHCSHQPH